MPDITGRGPTLGAAVRSALNQVTLGRARPSFDRVSAPAQFRQLSRSAAGRRALSGAGVSVTDRTARRWVARRQAPSKANAAAIARAYRAMQRGGIPEWAKRGEVRISGVVAIGRDVRDRGEGMAPLLIEAGGPAGRWERIEQDWRDIDDDELEDDFAEDVIEDAIDDVSPGGWDFPGGSYSVSFSG